MEEGIDQLLLILEMQYEIVGISSFDLSMYIREDGYEYTRGRIKT